MRDIILNQPSQITHSLEVNKDVKVKGDFDCIVLAGLGGSWHAGEILNTLNLPLVPLFIHRSYDLPNLPGFKKPLIIPSSFSGNTEETLSAYEAARSAGYGILVNTSGGKLAEMAQTDGIPWSKIDYAGMQPRHTTLASFTSLYITLKNSGLVKDITASLEQLSQTIANSIPQLETTGKKLATAINGKIPVYLAADQIAYAAWNFKIQTNENAKYPAYWNKLPEMNHNELLGFSNLPEEKKNLFHSIILRTNSDHPRVKARMDVTSQLFQQWGVTVSDVSIEGETLLEQVFNSVALGLWTTYHLAQLRDIDPIPVEGVESFKAKLKEVAG